MADEGPDKDSKTEEPTGKRLADARNQGDLPKSMDLVQWATLAAAASLATFRAPLFSRRYASGWAISGSRLYIRFCAIAPPASRTTLAAEARVAH